MLLLHSRVPKACKYLSRDEAAEAHVHVLHKRHAEQGQTRLYACQDLAVPCQRVCSPFRLPARKLFLHRLEALGVETLRPKKALVQQALAARVKPAAHLRRSKAPHSQPCTVHRLHKLPRSLSFSITYALGLAIPRG